MKKVILLTVASILLFGFTSCGLSPCDCAKASLNNDTKTIKKCEEKEKKMSQSEQLEWNKKKVECIENN